MGTYYDTDDERYRGRESDRGREYYDRGRGQRYGGAYERDQGWEGGRENPSRYGTGWSEDYQRGYSPRYFTGDEVGRGFAGGRGLGETPDFERGYGRSYGTSGYRPENVRHSERYYEGTNRPPEYGRGYGTEATRTYRGEGIAGERDWFDRASDEVSSWFGDEEAERRRRRDKIREGKYRGRGPKGYRRSDERIKEDINDRLTDYPYLDASEIVVSVKDAEVTLSGTVNDRRDKHIAEDIAESVSGVRNVQNSLRVNEEQVSTAGLETSARAATHTRL